MIIGQWKHNKTGKVYDVLDTAIECTNGREELKYVVYVRLAESTQLFVREKSEFEAKFTRLGGDV